MMGTPAYMSPEQARGKNVDYRTDIYALGCMEFQMVTGRLPFFADNAVDVLLKHITEPPPVPSEFWPDIPEALEQVILGMMEKDPGRRLLLGEVRGILNQLRETMGFAKDGSGRTRRITGQQSQEKTPVPSGSVPPPILAAGSASAADKKVVITSPGVAAPRPPSVVPSPVPGSGHEAQPPTMPPTGELASQGV